MKTNEQIFPKLDSKFMGIRALIMMLCFTGFAFGQNKTTKGLFAKDALKVENISVVVTVDSAEELESTFNLEDFKDLINETGENEELSFKIICNGDLMKNGKKSSLSYEVKGDAADLDNFLERVWSIREAAVNYYNNKKK